MVDLPPEVLNKEKDYTRHPSLLKYHVRRLIEANRLVGTYMKDTELLRSGLIRLEGFLRDAPLVEAVEKQILDIKIRDYKTDTSRIVNLTGTPGWIAGSRIWPLVKGIFQDKPALQSEVALFFGQNTYLQHLFNRPDDGDEQKVFHSDTFFHAVKFWYFPHEVMEEDGAFWYVPYSPVVTDKLIDWHKARVEEIKNDRTERWRGIDHLEGSFRINEQEIRGLGLEPIPVEVKADTLVIANVFGFHKRGDTKKPAHRVAVHGSIRISNPFGHPD